MQVDSLLDVDIGTLVVEETVVAFASEIVCLRVSATILQYRCQCYDGLEKQSLTDLA